jgi:signal transduction histidine kinase/CheY-like chemotaxis protein
VSELNYASQLLATSLVRQSHDPGEREASQVAFDVMWTRMEVAREEQLERLAGFEAVFDAYRAFLQKTDPLLFGEQVPPPETLLALADEVTEIARSSRQAWLDVFSLRRSTWEIAEQVMDQERSYRLFEISITVLVLCLMLYVFAEIWFAGRASRKEAKLRWAASQASKAKSRFIATVSHEVRTPLNGILGTADLLAETSLSREQAQYVDVLRNSGRVLLDLINDILDFSKFEAGQFTITAAPFDLDDVLVTARDLYTPLARQKQISLSVWHERGQTPPLHGDARRLQQVVNNLVSNAIKFTDAGSVEVSVRYRSAPEPGPAQQDGPENSPAGLFIWVTDTGCGIAEDEQAQVFKPFSQSSSGLDRAHAGTGLGLTISRDLCEAMGGHLGLSSVLGQGSTFEIFLPLGLAQPGTRAPMQAADAPEPHIDLCGADVLVVDDNRTNRFLLRKFMAAFGCAPREAASGLEAISAVQEAMPEWVLMDVQMPHMDGMTATRHILDHAARTDQPPPVIIGVTANTQPDQIESYLAAGMRHVVAKPVRRADLAVALQVARRKAVASAA